MTNDEFVKFTDPVSAPAGPAVVAGVDLLTVFDTQTELESVSVTPDGANKTALNIGCALFSPTICNPASEK
jgi:hypothetical protein